ncbi:MAG: 30S ribosomal protein S3 [Candidatus Theseobacter exili]|nr:30S ribosomal protein S3 [Candidatus Theseobacter exili]
MGQKVHPIGFRLGITEDWRSNWFAEKGKFADFLHEDLKIRDFIKKKLYFSGVPKIQIGRTGNEIRITVYTARPGIVIGRKGQEIDNLKAELSELSNSEINLDIKEVKRPETNAVLVSENIAQQLERRISFRRAMKKAVSSAMSFGAEGIKVRCAGRLGGADMSRVEGYKEGKIPLHTIRANIDYGFTVARTTYGSIGVKVWIYKGENLPKGNKEETTDAVNA